MSSDSRILELARRFEAYPGAIEPTLRGQSIVEFAHELLAKHDVERQDAGEQPEPAE